MKFLFASMLSLMGAAHAATVHITNVPCEYFCFNVPNDAGIALNYVDSAPVYGRVLVNINGDTYDSGLYAIARYAPVVDLPLYDPTGNVVIATLNFVRVNTGPCQRQGRVTVCPHTTTLNGTLTY